MADTIERIRLFLASPGDVAAEREAVRRVADELNRTTGMTSGFVIQVVGWETDAMPAYGGDPQALINQQIADMETYDLFVGIMWNRFGQPTPRAGSGSEEEFQRAVEAFERNAQPQIWVYFSEAPATFRTQADLDQKAKVIAFKSGVQKTAITVGYDGAAAFEPRFRQDLSRWIALRATSAARPPLAEPSQVGRPGVTTGPAPAAPVDSSGDLVLLGPGFYRAQSVRESGGQVAVRVQPDSASDEAALRSLADGFGRSGGPVPYAYQNTAFPARVASVNAESEAGRTFIEVVLRADTDRRDVMEMGFNGISADDLATMRARLILLDEAPGRDGRTADPMLMAMVQGFSGLEIKEGAFKELWREAGGDPDAFLRMARLWAAFLLVASGTCEQILELSLGPIAGNEMPVRFRGRRRRAYDNVAPTVIDVAGTCRLSP
jgi:hypothetical protein